MNVKISCSNCKGQIKAIPSKSHAHRIAICNFIAGNEPNGGSGQFKSEDIIATERCLNGVLQGDNTLDCGESGSTLRFLLPLMAARGGRYKFVGKGKLMSRPHDELFKVLIEHGVKVEKNDGIEIDGKLTAGEYRLRGDISSQYVSGLLMALTLLEGKSEIVLTTALSSAPYVEITLDVLKGYGAKIEKTNSGFIIDGNQKLSGQKLAEGDWSNAAFFLVLGAIQGDIKMFGLNEKSLQADKKILEILRLAGAKVDIDSEKVTVEKGELKAFTVDAEDCPDIVPIAAVLAANCKGETRIKNISRLKIKESDRIESTMTMLKAFSIDCECDGRDLTVHGGTPIGGKVDCYNDHRIAMSGAIMAVVASGTSEIINAQAVSKSYPSFYEDLKSIGGSVEYV